jgi:hypothetical protein
MQQTQNMQQGGNGAPRTATTVSKIDDQALQELQTHFRGELMRPADEQYNSARAVFNGMIDR